MRLFILAACFWCGVATVFGDNEKDVITEPRLADFGEFVLRELEAWKAPGASVAIVRSNELIVATGYGFRDLAERKPMTGKTVQPIASISKSFTAASLAVLARDGKLRWDTPVREYMPEFRLFDEYATAHVSPRDLVTHGTGLPRHDWVWVGAGFSREELVRRLRFLEPSAEMRTKYQYNNLAFCTAGYLAGRVDGSSWEELVRTRIFEPLGMKSSSFSVKDLRENEDHATPYRLDEKEEPVAIRYLNVDALGPAGAINSSASDMSRYLRMYIGRGKFEGKEILAATDVADMTSQKIVVADGEGYRELGSAQYGMGFRITTYRGRKMVHHSGALRGLSAMMAFLPEERIGVFVAVNCSDSSLPTVLVYGAFDRLLRQSPIDWSKRFRDRRARDKEAREEAKKVKFTNRRSGTAPSHALEEYAGEYEHAGYGVFRVAVAESALEGTFNAAKSKFEHFHYDVFAAPKNEASSFSEMKIQFATSVEGDVESVKIQFEPQVPALVFKRKADAEMLKPEFLKGLVGEYQIGASRAVASLRADDKLMWTVGGVTRELEPLRGKRFALKERDGFTVEFMEGQVAVHSPSGSSVGRKVR